jgi:hypothetical protein
LTFQGNGVSENAGGLFFKTNAIVTASTFQSNSVGTNDGGLYTAASASITVTDR